MKRLVFLSFIFTLIIGITSCDYFYRVSLHNKTDEILKIKIVFKKKFQDLTFDQDTINTKILTSINSDTMNFSVSPNGFIVIGSNRGTVKGYDKESILIKYLEISGNAIHFKAENEEAIIHFLSLLPHGERLGEKVITYQDVILN